MANKIEDKQHLTVSQMSPIKIVTHVNIPVLADE